MKVIQSLRSLSAALVLGVALIGSASANTFTEIPDAGDTIGTANDTAAALSLNRISGSLSNEPGGPLDLVDLYRIVYPGGWRVFHTGPGNIPGMLDDPVLFLFDAAGVGIAMDDESGGFGQASFARSLSAGVYYLGIALAGMQPLDTSAGAMFDAFGDQSLLSNLGLGSWGGSPFALNPSIPGAYSVSIVPVPGTLLLVVLGLALGASGLSRGRRS